MSEKAYQLEIDRLLTLADKLDPEGATYRFECHWDEESGGTAVRVLRCFRVVDHFRAGKEPDLDLGRHVMRQVLGDLLDSIDSEFKKKLEAITEAEKLVAERGRALVEYGKSVPSYAMQLEAKKEVERLDE